MPDILTSCNGKTDKKTKEDRDGWREEENPISSQEVSPVPKILGEQLSHPQTNQDRQFIITPELENQSIHPPDNPIVPPTRALRVSRASIWQAYVGRNAWGTYYAIVPQVYYVLH